MLLVPWVCWQTGEQVCQHISALFVKSHTRSPEEGRSAVIEMNWLIIDHHRHRERSAGLNKTPALVLVSLRSLEERRVFILLVGRVQVMGFARYVSRIWCHSCCCFSTVFLMSKWCGCCKGIHNPCDTECLSLVQCLHN